MLDQNRDLKDSKKYTDKSQTVVESRNRPRPNETCHTKAEDKSTYL